MVEQSIAFVDAHHHLWDLERHPYEWLSEPGWDEETAVLGDYRAIRRSYLAAEMLRDASGTGLLKTVHIQADWSGSDPVAETTWLDSCADEAGIPTAIVGYADPSDPQLIDVLDRHMTSSRFRGIRCTPGETRPTEANFRRGIRQIGQAGLSFDLRATPENIVETSALAREIDSVLFIVGHTGEPLGRCDTDRRAWRTAMRRLSPLPNVAIKISGLGMRDHHWSVDSIRPWVLETIDMFGVERCMFGTNWPVDSLYSTYAQLVDAYRAIVAPFNEVEQRNLLGGNAERLYRI